MVRPTLPELVSEMAREAGTLIRQEIALAKAEAGEKLSLARSAVVMLAAGGVTLLLGAEVLLAAAVLALALVLPAWLAALIVGAVVIVAGAVLLLCGRANLKGDRLAPRRTTASLQRDFELVRSRVTP